MKETCHGYRRALEAALARGSLPRELAWREHVLACAACRELFAAEEALDELLASLPEPRLPARLAQRVLARLQSARGDERELDRLLETDGVRVPESLPRDVLAGLAGQRAGDLAAADAALERVLGRDAAVTVPSGLSQRVLSGLAQQRGSASPHAVVRADANRQLQRAALPDGAVRVATASPRPRLLRTGWIYAAAAGLLLAIGAYLWRAQPRNETPVEVAQLATPDDAQLAAADTNLLAALDVLEQWELLMPDDVDALLSTMDPSDEALLDGVESGAFDGLDAPKPDGGAPKSEVKGG